MLASRVLFASARDEAAQMIPSDAAGYVSVFLDPSLKQKGAVKDLLEHFPQAPSPDEARNDIIDFIDRGLAGIDATFEDDVEPSPGDQVVGFFLLTQSAGDETSGAALLRSAYEQAALSFLRRPAESWPAGAEEARYRGVGHFVVEGEGIRIGVLDGFVIVGDRRDFEARRAMNSRPGGRQADTRRRSSRALSYVDSRGPRKAESVNRTTLLPVAWVTAVLAAMAVVNEPLRGMFDGSVMFEWPGYLVFATLMVASVVGVALIIRARRQDRTFRGVISELTRLVAFGETIVIAAAWASYFGD